jgi:hypothetical protein
MKHVVGKVLAIATVAAGVAVIGLSSENGTARATYDSRKDPVLATLLGSLNPKTVVFCTDWAHSPCRPPHTPDYIQ